MSNYQYEVPPVVVPENDAGYFEKITQAVFQAGFSWQVIRNKWPNFVHAFEQFDIDRVATFNDLDIENMSVAQINDALKAIEETKIHAAVKDEVKNCLPLKIREVFPQFLFYKLQNVIQ